MTLSIKPSQGNGAFIENAKSFIKCEFTYDEHIVSILSEKLGISFDQKHQPLAIYKDNKCLGGAALKICESNKDNDEDIVFATEAFPELFSDYNIKLAIVSHIALGNEFRNERLTTMICNNVSSKCESIGVQTVIHSVSKADIQLLTGIYESKGIKCKTAIAFHHYHFLLVTLPAQHENQSEETLTYSLTKDPKFLEQYYIMRERAYKERLGVKNFSGEEGEYDRSGHIIIAQNSDKKVVGGTRVVISKPDDFLRLPLEDDDFKLENLFPELDLSKEIYGEITRFAVLPEYMKGQASKELTRLSLNKIKDEGGKYQFSVAPMLQARNSRIITKTLGFSHVIQKQITIPPKPTYEQYKVCLAITYLYSQLLSEHNFLKENQKLHGVS